MVEARFPASKGPDTDRLRRTLRRRRFAPRLWGLTSQVPSERLFCGVPFPLDLRALPDAGAPLFPGLRELGIESDLVATLNSFQLNFELPLLFALNSERNLARMVRGFDILAYREYWLFGKEGTLESFTGFAQLKTNEPFVCYRVNPLQPGAQELLRGLGYTVRHGVWISIAGAPAIDEHDGLSHFHVGDERIVVPKRLHQAGTFVEFGGKTVPLDDELVRVRTGEGDNTLLIYSRGTLWQDQFEGVPAAATTAKHPACWIELTADEMTVQALLAGNFSFSVQGLAPLEGLTLTLELEAGGQRSGVSTALNPLPHILLAEDETWLSLLNAATRARLLEDPSPVLHARVDSLAAESWTLEQCIRPCWWRRSASRLVLESELGPLDYGAIPISTPASQPVPAQHGGGADAVLLAPLIPDESVLGPSASFVTFWAQIALRPKEPLYRCRESKAGAGAELDPAGEIAEDRGTGPDHQPQGLVVLFRELSVCGAVEDGSDASASPPASLLATDGKNSLDDGDLGVPRMDCAPEWAPGRESSLRSAGWASKGSGEALHLAVGRHVRARKLPLELVWIKNHPDDGSTSVYCSTDEKCRLEDPSPVLHARVDSLAAESWTLEQCIRPCWWRRSASRLVLESELGPLDYGAIPISTPASQPVPAQHGGGADAVLLAPLIPDESVLGPSASFVTFCVAPERTTLSLPRIEKPRLRRLRRGRSGSMGVEDLVEAWLRWSLAEADSLTAQIRKAQASSTLDRWLAELSCGEVWVRRENYINASFRDPWKLFADECRNSRLGLDDFVELGERDEVQVVRYAEAEIRRTRPQLWVRVGPLTHRDNDTRRSLLDDDDYAILDAAFEGAYQKLATRYRRAGNVRLARKIEQADPGAGSDQWDPVLETVRAKWELRELAELLYPTDTARWLMTLDLTLMAVSDIAEELHRWATASRNALAADVPAHQALMAILAIWIAPSTAVSLDWRGALDTLVADRSLSRAVRYLALRARSARSEAESK